MNTEIIININNTIIINNIDINNDNDNDTDSISSIINRGICNTNTSNKWTLWFHTLNDNRWDLEDYKCICSIRTIEEFIYTFRNLTDITKGMFFIMRNDIHPIWESNDNVNGGYWSFKVLKMHSNDTWKYLASSLVTSTLTKNTDDDSHINGICVSPKYNNCIFKILNNDSKYSNVSMLNSNIPNIDISQPMYRAHKESDYLKH
jgi:hypothetical protein